MTPYRPISGNQRGERAEETGQAGHQAFGQQGVANRVVERADVGVDAVD